MSDLRDFSKDKQFTLILSLIFQAQTRAKDYLAIMFRHTMNKMHVNGKRQLEEMREYYRSRTQELLMIFSDVLEDAQNDLQENVEKISAKINHYGGAAALKVDCDHAIALNSNNHFPFLLSFYENKRKILFRLINTLD